MAGSGGASCWTRLALFSSYRSSIAQRVYGRRGNLQIQSLDSRKARRFISFRRRPSLFSALYRFLWWKPWTRGAFWWIGSPLKTQASKTLGFLKQASISLCLRTLFIRQSIWRCLYSSWPASETGFCWPANGVGSTFSEVRWIIRWRVYTDCSVGLQLRVWCESSHQFLVGIWKRSKLSAAIADSILPLWCSGRVGQRCSLFRRRDGATTRIGRSRTLLLSLFAGSKRRRDAYDRSLT